MTKIQNIAILTSGGDSQGMNACIRSVTRKAIAENISVFGVLDGFNGLIDNDLKKMDYKSDSNIIQRGGTVLGSARSKRFLKKKYRKLAYDNLVNNQIDAIVVIGGDGSFNGARVFNQEFDIPFIGIPGTIDNDIIGTDYTIGFDTALNNIIEAIDKIRDTASSHHRIFLIEVMGNSSGMLALNAALTTGAEDVFLPETKEDFNRFETKIKMAIKANKSSIMVVSEGDEIGGAKELYAYLREKGLHDKIRVCILGHVQRGGSPSFKDRKMATLFGAEAVSLLIEGKFNFLLGTKNNEIYHYRFNEIVTKKPMIDEKALSLIYDLSVY